MSIFYNQAGKDDKTCISWNSQRGTGTKDKRWLPKSCKQKVWWVESSWTHANHRIRAMWDRKRPQKAELSVPVWWYSAYFVCWLYFCIQIFNDSLDRLGDILLKRPTRYIFPVWKWMDLVASPLVHMGLKNQPKPVETVSVLLLHGVQWGWLPCRMGLLKVRTHIYFFPKPHGQKYHQ